MSNSMAHRLRWVGFMKEVKSIAVVAPKFIGAILVSILTTFASRPACAVVPTPLTVAQVKPENGRVKVNWTGPDGVLFQLEGAPSISGPWQPVDAPTTNLTTTNVITDSMTMYRVSNYTNTTTYQVNGSTNSRETPPPPTPTNRKSV